MNISNYIDDLCRRLDASQESSIYQAWNEFLCSGSQLNIFSPKRRTTAPTFVNWPDIRVNAAVSDRESMLISEFKKCSDLLANGSDDILHVRANYGTGILPSLFGCEVAAMPEEINTLPCCKPLESRERIRELIKVGIPAVKRGFGADVFATGEQLLEIVSKNEMLRKFVTISPPDLQGPIDAAEVIWGSDIFLAFYDEPELVLAFLDLVTQTYMEFMRSWYALVPPKQYSVDWGWMYKGLVMLRNDSLTNLSPDIYENFVKPFDQQILDAFGGGAIHFCGRGDHYIATMSTLRGLHAIQLSQPELNKMETIYSATVDQGIRILGFYREVADSSGRPLHGLVHCPDKPWARILK